MSGWNGRPAVPSRHGHFLARLLTIQRQIKAKTGFWSLVGPETFRRDTKMISIFLILVESVKQRLAQPVGGSDIGHIFSGTSSVLSG